MPLVRSTPYTLRVQMYANHACVLTSWQNDSTMLRQQRLNYSCGLGTQHDSTYCCRSYHSLLQRTRHSRVFLPTAYKLHPANGPVIEIDKVRHLYYLQTDATALAALPVAVATEQ